MLHLVSDEGRIKHILQLYKRLIQPFLSFLWLQLVTHFIIRATPIDDINGNSYKQPLLFNQSYKAKITLLVIYGLRGIHTHTYTHTHSRSESDFKKPGTCRPQHIWFKNLIRLLFVLICSYLFGQKKTRFIYFRRNFRESMISTK